MTLYTKYASQIYSCQRVITDENEKSDTAIIGRGHVIADSAIYFRNWPGTGSVVTTIAEFTVAVLRTQLQSPIANVRATREHAQRSTTQHGGCKLLNHVHVYKRTVGIDGMIIVSLSVSLLFVCLYWP